MCLFKTTYAPYEEPPPRIGNHTAHYRPASRHSHTSYHRHSSSVARLPPPARRSHDYYYRSSASSLPVTSERRYVEYHEPARRSLVVERQASPVTVRREKVVYRS